MRSRLDESVGSDGREWIISACAEQTTNRPVKLQLPRDHLRVCGADADAIKPAPIRAGSSPRVRSRLLLLLDSPMFRGIISACAEQTCPSERQESHSGDHLRVCGADGRVTSPAHRYLGSSPRVRSRPADLIEVINMVGIISACAEQTSLEAAPLQQTTDHLRVCGAD